MTTENDKLPASRTRAHAVFQIKECNITKAEDGTEERTIVGVATTPTPDRMGDIVEPKGAQFALPVPVLWQHRSSEPVGHVTEAAVTDEGIAVVIKLANPYTESETLNERLRSAWAHVQEQLVRGLSIGFNPLEYSRISDTYSYRFLSWEWLELSLVTIPANAEANIQTVKTFDDEVLQSTAASGNCVVRLDADSKARARAEHERRQKLGVVFLK